VRLRSAGQVVDRVPQNFDDEQQQKDRDRRGRDGFILAMPVWMILIGRLPCGAHADEAGDVRRCVRQRMETVGQDADGAARVPEHNLGDRDEEIQEKNVQKDAGDCRIPVRAESRGLRAHRSAHGRVVALNP